METEAARLAFCGATPTGWTTVRNAVGLCFLPPGISLNDCTGPNPRWVLGRIRGFPNLVKYLKQNPDDVNKLPSTNAEGTDRDAAIDVDALTPPPLPLTRTTSGDGVDSEESIGMGEPECKVRKVEVDMLWWEEVWQRLGEDLQVGLCLAEGSKKRTLARYDTTRGQWKTQPLQWIAPTDIAQRIRTLARRVVANNEGEAAEHEVRTEDHLRGRYAFREPRVMRAGQCFGGERVEVSMMTPGQGKNWEPGIVVDTDGDTVQVKMDDENDGIMDVPLTHEVRLLPQDPVLPKRKSQSSTTVFCNLYKLELRVVEWPHFMVRGYMEECLGAGDLDAIYGLPKKSTRQWDMCLGTKGAALWSPFVQDTAVPNHGYHLSRLTTEEALAPALRRLCFWLRATMAIKWGTDFAGNIGFFTNCVKIFNYAPREGTGQLHWDFNGGQVVNVLVFLSEDFGGGELALNDGLHLERPARGKFVIWRTFCPEGNLTRGGHHVGCCVLPPGMLRADSLFMRGTHNGEPVPLTKHKVVLVLRGMRMDRRNNADYPGYTQCSPKGSTVPAANDDDKETRTEGRGYLIQ